MFSTLPAQVHLALLAAPQPGAATPSPSPSSGTTTPTVGVPNLDTTGIQQWLADNPLRIIVMFAGLYVAAQFKGGKLSKVMGNTGVLLLGAVLFFSAFVLPSIGKGIAGLLTP